MFPSVICFELFFVCSVQFSRSVVSDSLRPHESQQARPPCPSPTPGGHPDSCPLSQWCHPAILSSVVPFSSCPQSLPASESFPMSQILFFFTYISSGSQHHVLKIPSSPIVYSWHPCPRSVDCVCVCVCVCVFPWLFILIYWSICPNVGIILF